MNISPRECECEFVNFSDAFRIEKNSSKFSRDGKYLAYTFQKNVFVRNARNNKIVRSFTALDVVEYIEWSPDSKFLLSALYQRGIIQVLSLQFPDWKCKIRESEIGIERVLWSPDSRNVLSIGYFNVCICIWSLSDLSVKLISNLKSDSSSMIEFSNDGNWLAVIERLENSDCVSTFSSTSWLLSKRFPCDKIDVIGGLSWSSDSRTICVWDKRVDVCRVIIISLIHDSVHLFEKDGLGVGNLSWSPSGQFLAIGCCDGKVRLLNYITWSEYNILYHTDTISSTICSVYKEVSIDKIADTIAKTVSNVPHMKTLFKEVASRPIHIKFESRGFDGKFSNYGVGLNCFSYCGQFLATSCYSTPAALWIWTIPSGVLNTFLSFNKPIVDVAWDPSSVQLAVATESKDVCLWTPVGGAYMVLTPVSEIWNIFISSIKWHPSGHTLAINSNNIMILLWFCL